MLLASIPNMFAIIIAGIIAAIVVLFVIARYAKDPAVARHEVEGRDADLSDAALAPDAFFDVVRRLLARMGLRVADRQMLSRNQVMRLEVVGDGPLSPSRYVVYAFAKPQGDEVGASELLEVASDVEHSDASRGLVITPYGIELSATAGLGTDLDLVDGLALLRLVDEHAPELRPQLAGRRLRGRTPARTRSTAPEPRFVAAS